MAVDRGVARCGDLGVILDGEGLDGLIITHLPNIRYLTGFSGSAGVALVCGKETTLFTDPRYGTQVEDEVGADVRTEIVPTELWPRVWEALADYSGANTIGFEGHAVTVEQAKAFAAADVSPRLEPAAPLVERLRVRKDAEEVTAIREAARVATEAFENTLERIRVGLTELQVAGMLELALREGGSEWHPFPTIAASGSRSALPHAQSSGREIQAGDWLLLDFGAQVDGYCADISRTIIVGGRADEQQRSVYELVRETQRIACLEIRAGMSGREADAIARSLLETRGYGEAFQHSLGHGLGLEVHEEPRISKSNEDLLQVGAVVTIEPGVYLPGWGGVRIEDDVYLNEGGSELLSDGNTELRELT